MVANVCLDKTKAAGNQGWLIITTAWGLTVFVAVTMVGRFSGAHLNPAVTIALTLADKFDASMVAPYLLAQFGGAMAGSALAYLCYRDHYRTTTDEESVRGTFWSWWWDTGDPDRSLNALHPERLPKVCRHDHQERRHQQRVDVCLERFLVSHVETIRRRVERLGVERDQLHVDRHTGDEPDDDREGVPAHSRGHGRRRALIFHAGRRRTAPEGCQRGCANHGSKIGPIKCAEPNYDS